LVKRHLLKEPKFKPGQLVKHAYNDVVYETVGTYYSEELQPVLFVRDSESRIAAVDQNMYLEYKGSVNV
jgi:hypothetical protein